MSHLHAVWRPPLSVQLQGIRADEGLCLPGTSRGDESKTTCRWKATSEWARSRGSVSADRRMAAGLRQLCRLSGLIGNDVSVLQAGWPRLAAACKVQSGFSEIHVEFSPNPPPPPGRLSNPHPALMGGHERQMFALQCLSESESHQVATLSRISSGSELSF